MEITIKRVPGTKATEPSYQAFKDGVLWKTEEIDGREDVGPAFLRLANACTREFGVGQFYKAAQRRDDAGYLTWTSEISKSKEMVKPKEKTEEVNSAPLPKNVLAMKLSKDREILPEGATTHLRSMRTEEIPATAVARLTPNSKL